VTIQVGRDWHDGRDAHDQSSIIISAIFLSKSLAKSEPG